MFRSFNSFSFSSTKYRKLQARVEEIKDDRVGIYFEYPALKTPEPDSTVTQIFNHELLSEREGLNYCLTFQFHCETRKKSSFYFHSVITTMITSFPFFLTFLRFSTSSSCHSLDFQMMIILCVLGKFIHFKLTTGGVEENFAWGLKLREKNFYVFFFSFLRFV